MSSHQARSRPLALLLINRLSRFEKARKRISAVPVHSVSGEFYTLSSPRCCGVRLLRQPCLLLEELTRVDRPTPRPCLDALATELSNNRVVLLAKCFLIRPSDFRGVTDEGVPRHETCPRDVTKVSELDHPECTELQ